MFQRLVIVGLTGGIASGKSLVGSMLRKLGLPVVDADHLARSILEPGEDAYRDVVDLDGQGILGPDGAINREKLGLAVFQDEQLRLRLEAVTHPRIAMMARQAFDLIAKQGGRIAVYEAALLVESGVYKSLDALLVVTADEAIRIERIMARDNATEMAARARMKVQWPDSEKIKVADFVIDNSDEIETTRKATEKVFQALLERFGVNPGSVSSN